MLHLTLLTLALLTSQTLEREVSRTVEEFLFQLGLTPAHYAVVISDQVPQGAAVLQEVNTAGEDTALFMFDRGLLIELTRRERRVLMAHEVGHLAPECQPWNGRIYQELCADAVSLELVPVEDVSGLLSKSIRMFSSYFARQEFILRLAIIQGKSSVGKAKLTVFPSSGASAKDGWMYCD